jgi:NTE family protein
LLSCFCLLLLASGCASYGVIENGGMSDQSSAQQYSIKAHALASKNHEILLLLSFSGGGTRAAAMAYGVMQELRDTNVMLKKGSSRLLDEVDTISSVSGGSFTAAYYGVHGEGMFDTFEEVFLRKNVEKPLIASLFNPLHWFSNKGRTEQAVQYYNKHIFHGATYADMMKPGRPLIIINGSDLAYGIRFSFVQEYFDLLCSDLLSFPVARAVTASSAVPIAFNPIVVENYSGCIKHKPDWLQVIRNRADAEHNSELATLAAGLESYTDKDQRKFIHFVDGGITDNVGVRAFYDVVELMGGPEAYLNKTNQVPASKLVVITIDASTSPVYAMDETNRQPSIREAMSAMSGVQLHRYNNASIDLLQNALFRWTKVMSTPEQPVTPYFIEVSFENIKESPLRQFFNTIPTSFFLENVQVDKLIEAGRQLLRDHPEFQRLLADIKNS